MSCEYHYEESKKRPNYYSECIKVTKNHIENDLEFSVNEFDKSLPRSEELSTLGRVSYSEKSISIHCYCAGCALLTLLHEAGHAMHYLRCKDDEEIPTLEERELTADKLGHELGISLGFDLEVEWKEFVHEIIPDEGQEDRSW